MTIPHSGSFSTYISTALSSLTQGRVMLHILFREQSLIEKKGGDMAFFQLLKLLGARECTQTIIFLKQMNDKLTWA